MTQGSLSAPQFEDDCETYSGGLLAIATPRTPARDNCGADLGARDAETLTRRAAGAAPQSKSTSSVDIAKPRAACPRPVSGL